MAVIFNQGVLHDKVFLLPGIALGFEDPDADAYFVNNGWASLTKDTPVFTYNAGAISVDADAVVGTGPNRGQRVMDLGE